MCLFKICTQNKKVCLPSITTDTWIDYEWIKNINMYLIKVFMGEDRMCLFKICTWNKKAHLPSITTDTLIYYNMYLIKVFMGEGWRASGSLTLALGVMLKKAE